MYSSTPIETCQRSKYRPEFAKQLKDGFNGACLSIREIAKLFGVHQNTILGWRSRYPEFKEAMDLGAEAIDDAVERSMAKLALGYKVKTKKAHIGRDGTLTEYTVTDYVPPSFAAQQHWLKHRRREKWGESSLGPDGLPLAMNENMPTITISFPPPPVHNKDND